MSARDRILGRVRATARPIPAPDRITPAMARARNPVARFIERAEAMDATTTRLASLDDLPAAVADELRNRNLPAIVRTGDDPAFDRDWGTVERSIGPGRAQEPATLTRALLASAETGALLVTSGPENPITLNFLGETHFAVVHARDVQPGFEGLWSEVRSRGLDPRTVSLIAGPSRSADIGQTLQLGAHGPVALHVFLIEDDDDSSAG